MIKIAAHRIGTIEVESAFIMHPAVAECGVVGRPDETRGEVISAFVVLKHGQTPSDDLRRALLQTVRTSSAPWPSIGELNFVAMLPKTRSGKIMRRVLKAVVLNVDPGDITTIEDEGIGGGSAQAWALRGGQLIGLRTYERGSSNAQHWLVGARCATDFVHRGVTMLHRLSRINGFHVHGTDGPIGHVDDFIVDEATWQIRYLVVDTSNWMGGKWVAISPRR